MQFIKHAIIAAAGMGSRLGFEMPKCLVEVMGRRIIEYQLELLKEIKNVRIVVGYKDIEVIDFVKKIRNDIVFVRNQNYRHTTTLQSLFYGIQGINEPTLIMDGDIIFAPDDFNKFIDLCKDGISTIGVAQTFSENPIYVDVQKQNNNLFAVDFRVTPGIEYEWANIAILSPNIVENRNTYVYEQLKTKLPLRAAITERLEVDTPEDLRKAEEALKSNPMFTKMCSDKA